MLAEPALDMKNNRRGKPVVTGSQESNVTDDDVIYQWRNKVVLAVTLGDSHAVATQVKAVLSFFFFFFF